MPSLICKPAGVDLTKNIAYEQIVRENPYYLSFAYSDGKTIHVRKFRHDDIEAGWQEIEKLKDYSIILFFHSQRQKIYEKNIDNKVAYVAAGEMVQLAKKTSKQYSDAFFFKSFALEEISKSSPDLFFTFAGRWLMERIIAPKCAVAFLRINGDISILHADRGNNHNEIWYFDPRFIKFNQAVKK